MHLQLRTNNNNRTGRVIDTFTKQVLTETSLLAFKAVAQRFESAVVLGLHCVRFARVVEQRIDSLLKHTLLVAQNHLRCLDFDKAFQTVVADDDAAIQIVQVRCCEAAAIERNQRTQLRRNHGDNLQNHPLRTVLALRCAERFNNLQTLQSLALTLLRCLGIGFVAQIVRKVVKIQFGEQVVDGLCAHFCNKFVGVSILKELIIFWNFLHPVKVLLLCQQVKVVDALLCHLAGLNDDIALVVNHHIEFLCRQTKQITDFVRQRLEIPYMCYRHNQLDVSHTLTAYLLLCNFNTATVADDAFVADAFVLAAVALIVFYRTEDAFAEQTVTLRLVSTVVDCFRLQHLAARTLENLFRRCQAYCYVRELALCFSFLSKCHRWKF